MRKPRSGRLWRKRLPAVLQSEALECAHASLSMLAQYHGKALSLQVLRERFVPPTRGTSINELIQMADAIGMLARVYRAEPNHLAQLRLPCVLHWDIVHFIVLEACDGDTFDIVDPAIGRLRIGREELNRRFTGVVIEIEPGPEFHSSNPPQQRDALELLRSGVREHIWMIASVLLLAILLESLALTSPLFIQAVTDSILASADVKLLIVLTIAFAIASVLQTLISLARSSLLIRLGEELTVGWNVTVCSRLLRLPYEFFVRRSIGDIHSRFGSIEEIQRTVTHRFVEGALDGVTAILSLVMILLYSPVLAALTLGFALLYGIFRILTFPRLRLAQERGIRVHAMQQSLLLEILHGIHSIKANGREAGQLARYNRRTADTARAAANVQRWTRTVEEAGQLILRLQRVVAIAISAALAMHGSITAGMLVAYITYATQFSERSTRLLDLLSDWRMLILHGNRLSDIVLGESENGGGDQVAAADRADFTVSGLRFRYSSDGPWVLDGIDFEIRTGECVAIKGPSGTGKSTLAKLMIGLLEPEEGEISLGGIPIGQMKRSELREKIACVLQDDQLFNGTVAENIAFFEPGFDREQVVAAAKMAQIHADIMAMPLRYETRVIDLGASLSGGQRQRMMLARALYRNPKVLLLDEASSHLDLENERLINDAIAGLEITRIIIAHRPETLAIADRILELRDGGIEEAARGARSRVAPHRGAPAAHLSTAC
ncbi:peptidase domain-containing ABC transporter [[Pseudomonas] boreopolis]|uniref:peptidase domain-containing ABC transporter n=1 Tax=Xanthomonas boreopolis TaxID=86183 RepID=UPI003D9B98BF